MNDPYIELANGIVIQAAKDYLRALRSIARNPRNRSAQGSKRELERFFHSGWYAALTDADPDALIEKIKVRCHIMTAKEFLERAAEIDKRINSKLEQITSLNELTMKCTPALTGMPHGSNSDTSGIDEAIASIIDLQADVNKDIDKLIAVKREIMRAINTLKKPEIILILELRYLCFKPWEEIAIALNYSLDSVFRLHRKALAEIQLP